MEIRLPAGRAGHCQAASMGPPPFGDGDKPAARYHRRLLLASMGPPPFGDGDHGTRQKERRQFQCFNGATAFRRWRSADETSSFGAVLPLQWGHRLSAMEMGDDLHQDPDEPVASMGPPPFGDGDAPSPLHFSVVTAASMGPPPFGDGDRRSTNASRPGDECFNGATAFRRWRSVKLDVRLPHFVNASMGPPPFGDGDQKPAVDRRQDQRASMGPPPFGDGDTAAASLINEVTIQLQWGHRLSAMEIVIFGAGGLSGLMLQWGHRLSAMEIHHPVVGDAPVVVASMGPPPFGDGDVCRTRWSCRPAPGFNGATAFRRWRSAVTAPRPRAVVVASMGPPPFGDGDQVTPRPLPLQRRASMGPPPFGDGDSAPHLYGNLPKCASMGPPPFGDGDSAPHLYGNLPKCASMGPPPFGDGDTRTRAAP